MISDILNKGQDQMIKALAIKTAKNVKEKKSDKPISDIHLPRSNSFEDIHKFIRQLHIVEAIVRNLEEKKATLEFSGKSADYFLSKLAYFQNILKRFQDYSALVEANLVQELPERYYQNRADLLKNQGRGDIEVTEEFKQKILTECQNNQKESLQSWINYLTSNDAMYDNWFKYYFFTEILKLKKDGGIRRFKDSSPFPDVDAKIVAVLWDKYKSLQDDAENKDPASLQEEFTLRAELRKSIADSRNFKTDNFSPEELKTARWQKYTQGESEKLAYDVRQTNWCTAAVGTATEQLGIGDLHVCFVAITDETTKELVEIPIIAIRTEDDKIVEIRGTCKDQNLSQSVEPIIQEKLNEFPDKYKYLQKVKDMKRLTEIYNLHKNIIDENSPVLSVEELVFLYETSEPIQGFGYNIDPRIKEVQSQRQPKVDLAKIYKVEEFQIATSVDELNENTVVYYGDLIIEDTQETSFPKLKSILGDAVFDGSKVKYLPVLERIHGYASFEGSEIESLDNLKYIGGSALFSSTDILNLQNLEYIGRHADFTFAEIESLDNLKYIGGSAYFKSSAIKSFQSLEHVEGYIDFENCEIFNLSSLKKVDDDVRIVNSNLTLEDLDKVEVGGRIIF